MLLSFAETKERRERFFFTNSENSDPPLLQEREERRYNFNEGKGERFKKNEPRFRGSLLCTDHQQLYHKTADLIAVLTDVAGADGNDTENIFLAAFQFRLDHSCFSAHAQ